MNKINDNPNMLIPIFLGRIEKWQDMVVDLSEINHLLITGYSGCGKSTLIHNIVSNVMIYRSYEIAKFILLDQKGVELTIYNGCPHLFIPVATDEKRIEGALTWCVAEMECRIDILRNFSSRSIEDYNEKNQKTWPHILIVLDGYSADNDKIDECLKKILLNGRTAGMHIILSLSDTNNILNFINLFPSVCLFRSARYPRGTGISQKYLSVLSIGEFYYRSMSSSEMVKLSTPDIDFNLVERELKNIIRENKDAKYIDISTKENNNIGFCEEDIDALFSDAGRYTIEKDKASIGMLQRNFKIGFNRAARIMDQLSDAGVVGPEEGTAPRKILMSMEEFEKLLNN